MTWEKFLDIIYEEPLTLEQRRHVVIARLCGLGHIGEPEIRAIMTAIQLFKAKMPGCGGSGRTKRGS